MSTQHTYNWTDNSHDGGWEREAMEPYDSTLTRPQPKPKALHPDTAQDALADSHLRPPIFAKRGGLHFVRLGRFTASWSVRRLTEIERWERQEAIDQIAWRVFHLAFPLVVIAASLGTLLAVLITAITR